MYEIKPITSDKPLDCGPTALKMLLAYYGVDVDLETLTKECGVTLAGCTAADLMRVGRIHGLDMQCYSMDADELVRQDRPGIVYWRNNHWIVFCGRESDGRVWIANPDRGMFRMDVETFAAIATGLDSHPGQVVSIWNGEPHDAIATAPDNISAGTIFVIDGTYYKALTAIARGAAINGTNATPTSVADEINTINESE